MKQSKAPPKLPIFKDRFATLRSNMKMTQDKFAEFLGISRPTVGFYENGERIPDALVLRQIAERCCVSADWLLGLNEIQTNEVETKRIYEDIGLFPDTVEILKDYKNLCSGKYLIPIINLLVQQEAMDSEGDVWGVPILSTIENFLAIKRNPRKVYQITDGEILEKKSRLLVRASALRDIPASDIAERVLLSDIESQLKKLKENQTQK